MWCAYWRMCVIVSCEVLCDCVCSSESLSQVEDQSTQVVGARSKFEIVGGG